MIIEIVFVLMRQLIDIHHLFTALFRTQTILSQQQHLKT